MDGEDGRVVTFTTASHQQQQDESVLNDVLQELDRERTRRAELEAQLRVVAEERAQQSAAPPEEQHNTVEKRELIAMETERNELLQLLEKLTSNNDAITAASKSSTATSASLPLHVVRLLEIMPWDPRARQHTIATEEVYEWQVYDVKAEKWTSQLRQFPPFFRTMPIAKPTPGRIMDESPSSMEGLGRNRSRRIFGGESPPKQCVMTDAATTQVLNIRDGFPLPNDGGLWQWIGGWRIDKRVVATPKLNGIQKSKVDCDENGWSYAKDPRDFQSNPTELCWDTPDEKGESSVFRRKVRRRKWTRRRALLSYPFASEQTKEYLKSMAENAILEMTTSKLNDQLIETKMQLTKCEEKLMHNDDKVRTLELLEKENAHLKAASADLNYELSKSNRQVTEFQRRLTTSGSVKSLEQGSSASVEGSGDGGGLRRSHLENVDKIRSAFTHLVSETNDRMRFRSDDGIAPDSEDGDDSSSSSHSQKANETSANGDGAPESFDWKRFGRGGVFDKIKRSPAVQSLPPWRSPSHSDATVAVNENTKTPSASEQQSLSLPALK